MSLLNARRTKLKNKLHAQDPNCRVCERPTRIFAIWRHRRMPPDFACLYRLNGPGRARTLLCHECCGDLEKRATANIDPEELWAKSGRWPRDLTPSHQEMKP